MDLLKVRNIEFDGIDQKDYPDYCGAYIISAEYDGKGMTDEQIEELSDDSNFFHEALMDYLF
tara:strand:- start:168 stop:353 length:186 start_codon:yes stop_codon:yes gene_type:complete